MKKDRLINIRFLFCLFVGLMLGIIVGKLFLVHDIGIFLFVLSFVLMLLIMIGGIVYAKKTANHNKSCKYRKNFDFILKCSSIGVFSAFCVGVLIVIAPILEMMAVPTYNNEVIVSGVVSEYVDTEETYKKFILDDCCIVNGENASEIDFKILVYTSSYQSVKLGDNLTFTGEIKKYDYKTSFGFSQLASKIAYSAYASSSSTIVSSGEIGVRESIQNYINNILQDNLNEDNANISYAVLFGQKHGLSRNISDMFSYAGISHILAVSGLHIGVLVSVIWFLLNKIKMNRYAKLVIFALFLLFYSYLCAFSPSVCRASIMAFVLALCKLFRLEYDSLSSLSIAGIIILMCSPLSLFSISFQLSFLCIFSIISLAPSISYLFNKIKMPKGLGNALAVSIATNIVILPVCMNAFAKVSLLGIIANLFVLPIFSLTYILLFGVVLISCIIKPLGVLLCIPNLFMHLIKVVANYISQISFGVFKTFNVSYLVLFFIVLVSLVIHFVISKHWIKSVSVTLVTTITLIMIILSCVPTRVDGEQMAIANQRNSNVCFYFYDNKVSLIGSNVSLYNLEFMMKDLRIGKVDNIVAYDFQLNKLDELIEICNEFDIKHIWIPDKFEYDDIKNKLNNDKTLVSFESIKEYGFEIIELNNDIIGLRMDTGIGDILISNIDNSKSENQYLIDNYLNIDYLIVKKGDLWSSLENFDGKIVFTDDISTLSYGGQI